MFSVIIPTRNRRALLERALHSVWRQSSGPREVIVVDDGSTDDTQALLSSVRDRVRTISLSGSGPGAARNAGAQAATGEYVVFLDSDDLWFPWTLATFAAAIEAHQRPAYLCGAFRQFADEQDLNGQDRGSLQLEFFPNYLATWPRQLVIGAGMIAVRRDIFLTSGGFSEAAINLEDHDLSLRLGLAPGFVQVMQPVTLAWRLHDGGVTRDLSKSAAGCALLLETEARGGYPGGSEWAAVRRNIITTHTRAFTLESVRGGRIADAWRVYRATFAWHLALGRMRYLAMFPLLAAARSLHSRTA